MFAAVPFRLLFVVCHICLVLATAEGEVNTSEIDVSGINASSPVAGKRLFFDGISSDIPESVAQQAGAPSNAANDVEQPEVLEQLPAEYDVVIVGGGLVGSVVAAKLAQLLPDKRVLLLEAGAASQKVLGGKDVPASWNRHKHAWDQWPDAASIGLTKYDVPGNYETLQCWDRTCSVSWGKLVPYFQCKILGGCGVMNGALMQIPASENFAAWPAGWRSSDLQPFFAETQRLFDITSKPSEDGEAFLAKASGEAVFRESLVSRGFHEDPKLRRKANTFDAPLVTAKDGVRQSTASQLLPKTLHRKNFEMRLEHEVLKIEHSVGKATGLLVKDSSGSTQQLKIASGGLVVLSAGALNTPRMLLASGLDGSGSVGQGLTDHTLQFAVYAMPKGEGSDGAWPSLDPPPRSSILEYVATRSGPLAQFGPTFTAFFKAPFTPDGPNVWDVEAWVNPKSKPNEVHISIALMRPRCPAATLSIDPDGDAQIKGDLHAGCALDKDTLAWVWGQIDAAMLTKGGHRSGHSASDSMSHFAGSCKLGTCVSPQTLRLVGSQNVAVADASILASTVWAHPAMTLTAVGLKAADVLAASLPK